MNNRALLVVIIKEQRPLAYYAKFSKLFLVPENPLPPRKGDRGGLERRKALAALVLFVGRRYYLRPPSAAPTSGTPEALLEQASAFGTREAPLELPLPVERA